MKNILKNTFTIKLTLVILLFTGLLSNTYSQNSSTVSSASSPLFVRIEKPLAIHMIQPQVKKDEVFIQNEKHLLVKGRVTSGNGVATVLINKTETEVDSLGYFVHEMKVPYNDSELIIKAIDKKNRVTEEKIRINRPFGADPNDMQKRDATDYALLIGTNNYANMHHLTNPVFDVRTLSAELSSNYSFKVDTVINPTFNQILTSIRKYSSMQFNDDDQLFIFIAGHGEFDPVVREGYIVPGDALKDDANKISYLDHSKLKTIVNNIPCKHIFIVLDVCFGGTFDQTVAHRGLTEDNVLDRDSFVKRKLKHKTRLYLTSGGKEYVPDGRPGHHSPFTRQFLSALRTSGGEDRVLTTNELYGYVDRVSPEPRKGEFGDNEPGSDFVFISK